MKKNLKAIEQNSISDTEIRYYLPNAKILSYPELKNYNNIEQLLPKIGSYFILLYLDTPNSGHWTCLKRTKKGVEYFCSYGTPVDGQLREWYSDELREELDEDVPYLSNLLNKTKLDVFYNDIDYQSKKEDIVTCGRHMINYIKSDKDLKSYFISMKKGKGSYDEKVSYNIAVILD